MLEGLRIVAFAVVRIVTQNVVIFYYCSERMICCYPISSLGLRYWPFPINFCSVLNEFDGRSHREVAIYNKEVQILLS